MAWHDELSIGVVIILLLILSIFVIDAIKHDKLVNERHKKRLLSRRNEMEARYMEALAKMKNTEGGSTCISDHYIIDAAKKDEMREIIEEVLEAKEDELRFKQLLVACRDGAVLGFLGGAIIGGKDAAISGAFTWMIIKAIMTGSTFYI